MVPPTVAASLSAGSATRSPAVWGNLFPIVNCASPKMENFSCAVPLSRPDTLKTPKRLAKPYTPRGWFHTGDLGTIDAEGCLFITGRKKDIFNCSDGSNIYPGYIELLLENEPFVRQAILLGDRRPFIAALIVPDKKKIAAELHKENAALTESEIAAVLQSRIDQLNQRLEQFEKVRRCAIIRDDFSDEVRSVTVFQKIKVDRKAVEQRYQKEIEEIYGLAEEGRA